MVGNPETTKTEYGSGRPGIRCLACAPGLLKHLCRGVDAAINPPRPIRSVHLMGYQSDESCLDYTAKLSNLSD